MYAPANKNLPFNWLPVGPPPPPKPDCSCRRLVDGEWVSIAHEHKRPENHYAKSEWPAERQGHRDAVMAREDNVLDWATPYGFIKAFDLDPNKPGLARELELQYLMETQDRELAPIWLEMRENGIDAISQSSAKYADDNDETMADAIPEDADAIYTTPEDARRELWWMEEMKYRWECSAIIGARFIPIPDTQKVVLRATQTANLTKQQQTDWLNAIVADLRARDALPTFQQLVGAQQEMHERRAYYGDNWQLSLLQPHEQDAWPQYRRVLDFLNEADADPLRNAFDEADAEEAFQKDRPEYAGGGTLGFDDWENSELSDYADLDHDPFKVLLYELGEWGE